jgi:thiol-disulfide isomerase/thioredoxin
VLAVTAAACGGGNGSTSTAGLSLPYEHFDGSGSSTLADLRGRAVVVNFWASWCTPCITEMPDFEKVHQQLGDRVTFVGLNVQDSPTKASQMVTKTGVTYRLGSDTDGAIAKSFMGTNLPVTVLLRPDGTVAAKHLGALRTDDLRALISSKLGIAT